MNIRRTKIYIPTPQPTNYLAKYARWFAYFILGLLCYAMFMVAIRVCRGCGEKHTMPTNLGNQSMYLHPIRTSQRHLVMYEIHILDKSNGLSWKARRLCNCYEDAEHYASRLVNRLNRRPCARTFYWIVINNQLTTIQEAQLG